MDARKKLIVVLAISIAVVLTLSLMLVFWPTSSPPAETSNQWTWISGNSSIDNKGTYGIQGVADAANVPGARAYHASWTDASGNFWLFGGSGYDNASNQGYLNDLWMFNVSDARWTWVSGNSTRNQPGIYGVQGEADAANVPGARAYPVSWTGSGGNLWLFGGAGYDNTSSGRLNDLWMFNVSDARWTWVSGSFTAEQPSVYGVQGVADAANIPGGRAYHTSWTDANSNFWLFGGYGRDNISLLGRLNDLWMFNVSDARWTWVSGSFTVDQPGVYGVQGVADATTAPGAREAPASWTGSGGNLWLFGGAGYDNASLEGKLNDLWMFNVSDARWTWVSGNSTRNQPGVYGVQGVANAANTPGARWTSNAWIDASGNFWLFGGNGHDNAGLTGHLNDLWMFDVVTKTWTWMSGNSTRNQLGIYGVQGMADAANVPGARQGTVTWMDVAGDLWLFGGQGYGSTAPVGNLNDLWKFTP